MIALRKAALLAVAWTLAMIAAGTGLLLSIRDRLPDLIVQHWSLGGADGWTSLSEALWTAGLASLCFCLLLLGVGALMHPSVRRDLAAVGAGTATLVAVVGYGTAWAQRDNGSVHVWVWIAGGVLAGLAAALGLLTVTRPVLPPAPPGTPPPPADALRLDPWLTASMSLTWQSPFVRVQVDEAGLSVRSVGLITWNRTPLDRITSAEVGYVQSPLREFGGWGWRITRRGVRGWIGRDGEALVVHRFDEPDIVLTIDDPEPAARVVNTLVDRIRTPPTTG